jgi:RloB-like protein
MRRIRPVPIVVKPSFAIVVDGETEVWYFQMLKRNERSINVNIEPKIPQRKKLFEQFETVIELSKDYTKVFWVIDLDVILKETKEAKAEKQTPFESFLGYKKSVNESYPNIKIIINSPCLEFWFLLHFDENADIFNNCNEATLLLKKHLIGYKKKQKYFTKQGDDIYLKLKPNLADALNNANALALFDTKNPYKGLSEMQLFFEANEFGQLFKK